MENKKMTYMDAGQIWYERSQKLFIYLNDRDTSAENRKKAIVLYKVLLDRMVNVISLELIGSQPKVIFDEQGKIAFKFNQP